MGILVWKGTNTSRRMAMRGSTLRTLLGYAAVGMVEREKALASDSGQGGNSTLWVFEMTSTASTGGMAVAANVPCQARGQMTNDGTFEQ